MTKLLVDYSSSSGSDNDQASDQQQQPPKRRRLDPNETSLPNAKKAPSTTNLPRLPGSFYSLYATNARTSNADDPSLHSGRKRQIAHKEGNWPTHIYLEWFPPEQQERCLREIIQHAQLALAAANPTATTSPPVDDDNVGQIHSLLRSDLDVQLPLHISLSAPLVLDTSQREDFQFAVQTAVGEYRARRHQLRVCKVEWVSNFDQTRWFLVLKLTQPANDDLNRLLDACNGCARKFGLPELYASKTATGGNGPENGKQGDDRFHISIAWTLQRPYGGSDGDLLRVESLPSLVQLSKETIAFDTVKLKMGNAVHDIVLHAAEDVMGPANSASRPGG